MMECIARASVADIAGLKAAVEAYWGTEYVGERTTAIYRIMEEYYSG